MDVVCEVTLTDVRRGDVQALQRFVKDAFGARARTRTVERWLWLEERKPSPPAPLTHRVVAAPRNVNRGVGSRAEQ